MKKRVFVLGLVLGILIVLTFSNGIFADKKYPDGAITVIVPYNVGGSTDIYVRTLVKPLSDILKVPVNVTNIEGGMSVPAVNAVLTQPANGYTVYAMGSGDIINTVYGSYNFLQDFTPIARVQHDQGLLWVPYNSKFKDFGELLKDAKKNPGKQNWCGGRDFDEFVIKVFLKEANINAKYTPYKSQAEAQAALAGSHYDVSTENLGPNLSMWQAKKIRPVLVLSEKRLPSYKDIPTSLEYGINVTLGRWRGLAVKKGTPPEIIKTLENALKQAATAEVYKTLTEKTATNQRPGFLASEEMIKSIQEEYKVIYKIALDLGMIKK